MLTYLRYALATLCFAVSVGCLGLWWRSYKYRELAAGPVLGGSQTLILQTWSGVGTVSLGDPLPGDVGWGLASERVDDPDVLCMMLWPVGSFGLQHRGFCFPLWYPVLIFTLAGITSLRLGRGFTIRSAIIATTVVAGLLGMAVIL